MQNHWCVGGGEPPPYLGCEEKQSFPQPFSKEEFNMTEKAKTVTIRIPRLNPKQEDVFVSVNNYTCIVKRGVEVEVPEYVAEVLRHQEQMLEIIQQFEEAHR